MRNDSLLKKLFPSSLTAAVEIINLNAINNLPKGTEHFLSDLHGEDEAFNHILKSASGVIKNKIIDAYKNTLTMAEINELATLLYYPTERLAIIKKTTPNLSEWYKINLLRLIEIARIIASKYTQSKVRKSTPKDYAYIINELLSVQSHNENKENYYEHIISTIISLGQADNFIIAISNLIQRLAIDKLHIIGDIYDRGAGSNIIMDCLIDYHNVDIQWGNHDALWIGARYGNCACIANLIRINSLYNNLHILESGYGINLRPLAMYASKTYRSTELDGFNAMEKNNNQHISDDTLLVSKIHKAITILQLKLETALINSHPEYDMANRRLLETVGIDPELTASEKQIIAQLADSFMASAQLKKHIDFLLEKGSLYLVANGNLLFHGCVPTNSDGEFTQVLVGESYYAGKALFDKIDSLIRGLDSKGGLDYASSLDYMWYLWCGKNSPLYGRDKILTFEKYFVKNSPETENKNPYYEFIKSADFCDKIIADFNLDKNFCHIINGHMPVKVKDGESPLSAGGKHITIDGGLSKPYHEKTGISGYTLISDSQGLILVSHSSFTSTAQTIVNSTDLTNSSTFIERYSPRKLVKDTDIGIDISNQIQSLKDLINFAY